MMWNGTFGKEECVFEQKQECEKEMRTDDATRGVR